MLIFLAVTGVHWTGSPNKSIDQIGKNCPKNVRKLCFQPLWTIFGHFSEIFRHFRTFCRHSHFLGCPTICPLQLFRDEKKNLGHSKKKIFNKHFQGANSELKIIRLYIFQGKHPEFRRMAKFRKKKLLNAMAQVFPPVKLLVLSNQGSVNGGFQTVVRVLCGNEIPPPPF